VKDIVSALVFAAATPAVSGVFNAGYGAQITINQLAGQVIALAGSASKILHGPKRPGDVQHSCASADKLLTSGWQPRHTLTAGLAATFQYFSANKRRLLR